MVKITATYLGDLRCWAEHEASRAQLLTDAPLDNHGKGESFSPTDLFVTSFLTCVGTIMGIYAQKNNIDIVGMKMQVHKEMAKDLPRRIEAITMEFWMPNYLEERKRAIIESAVKTCPVHHSIHPDIKIDTVFYWPKKEEC